MKTEITHVFEFMRARPVRERHGETAFERYCESLPRIRNVDVNYFCCYMPSDTILWLRELMRRLPNHQEVGGLELVARYTMTVDLPRCGRGGAVVRRRDADGTKAPTPAQFTARLTENRLRQLFGGETNFYRVRMEGIVFRRNGMTLTCHCDAVG